MPQSISDSPLKTLIVGAGAQARHIAVRQRAGALPGVFWLGGFKSEMKGTKAAAIDRWGAEKGREVTRYDYSGHGESGGVFADGTIGKWLEESAAVYRQFCKGPQVLIGSSMGGWIALLLARLLKKTGGGAPMAGMVLIAPAVDFTEALMWKQLPADVQRQIMDKGEWTRPSSYSEQGYVITRGLIEEGRNHLLLGGLIETGCPVRILQGVKDAEVPWQHSADLLSRFASDDVVFTLIKDGEHRLSRSEDIERLIAAIEEF